MLNLTHLSDDALIEDLHENVADERKGLLHQLSILIEMEKRKLYYHYPDLYTYLTQETKIDGHSARRRIHAARLVVRFPELESLLNSGEMNLSLLDLADRYFERYRLDHEDQRGILNEISGLSYKSAQRVLRIKSGETVKIPDDSVRELTEELSLVSFTTGPELLEQLDQIRGLLAHVNPRMTLSEIFGLALKEFLVKHHPEKKAERAQPKEPAATSPATPSHRPTAAQVRALTLRDGYRCRYRDPKTQKTCGSRFGLEVDHIIPVALGGKTELPNLRWLCKGHNIRSAIRHFGVDKMQREMRHKPKRPSPAHPALPPERSPNPRRSDSSHSL